MRGDLENHLASCAFEQMRHVIGHYQNQVEALQEKNEFLETAIVEMRVKCEFVLEKHDADIKSLTKDVNQVRAQAPKNENTDSCAIL
jgi:demethoxyubiquinone hydroxylase (CLK1/Coq7/Cat5 family)